MDAEKLSAPCGAGGGERVQVTKAQARRLQLGISPAEFEESLETAEFTRYEY